MSVLISSRNSFQKTVGSGSSLLTGLIGYWALDETIGGTAFDKTAYDHDLVITGATLNQSGILGTSFSFDGSDHLRDADYDIHLCPINVTISAWINTTTNSFLGIVSNYDYETYAEGFWLGTENTKVRFGVADGANHSVEVDSTSDVNTGNWVHVVATSNGTDIRVYINGSLNCTPVSFPYSLGYRTDVTRFLMGDRNEPGTIPFIGRIDEVGIWSRELSTSEITELYNSGTGKTYPFS